MSNNNYALFYKQNGNDHWHSTRPDMLIAQWEDYAKGQGYVEYDIINFPERYDDFHLQLLTDVVHFNNRYYLPEEEIPYPDNLPDDIGQFNIEMVLDEDYMNDESDWEETYNKNTIDWGWGCIWTSLNTKFIMPDKTSEALIVAQNYINELPHFYEMLKNKSFGILNISEFSKFKWLAWIKGDKVRLIHQDYDFDSVHTSFDVLVDKTWFYEMCENLKNNMQKYADADQIRYEQYVKERYGK